MLHGGRPLRVPRGKASCGLQAPCVTDAPTAGPIRIRIRASRRRSARQAHTRAPRSYKVSGMGFDLAFSIKVFSALFAIMNPVANVPVFLSLTRGASDVERRRIAVTALIAVSVGCVVAAVAGGAKLWSWRMLRHMTVRLGDPTDKVDVPAGPPAHPPTRPKAALSVEGSYSSPSPRLKGQPSAMCAGDLAGAARSVRRPAPA